MTTPRIRGASARDVARAIVGQWCANDVLNGGGLIDDYPDITNTIAAALSERERETVERILDMVYSELARAPELYGDEWQERIRHADAARRETP